MQTFSGVDQPRSRAKRINALNTRNRMGGGDSGANEGVILDGEMIQGM